MHLHFKSLAILLALSLGVLAADVRAQAANAGKWAGITGEKGEFLVYIPAGYLVGASTNFYIQAKQKRFEIQEHVIVARLFNGALLRYEMYQGNVEGLEDHLAQGTELTNVRNVGDFKASSAGVSKNGRTYHTEYYNNGKRLYVLSSEGRDEKNLAAKAFFASARLHVSSGWIDPNSPTSTAKITLPRLTEILPEKLGDDHIVALGEVDRPPLILFRPRMDWSADQRHGVDAGQIKVRVVLSSNGTVSKVDIEKNNFFYMQQQALDAARKIVFIPAEKDGKLVSVSVEFTNIFERSVL
ncbi:MAG: Gram-negative bacterial tonB protein [Acidobacteria bacterium OLB17]|nr:MAG: Gram-negative bacterial tonB protein [Acidobacteria bacterium OLB17]MCZ2390116.1 energy transducer TonB [Acidobacteriota bacterium]